MNQFNFKLNLYWITGFINAKGYFTLTFSKKKLGFSITLRLLICQHSKGKKLINNLVYLFNIRIVYEPKNKNFTHLIISNFKIIYNKIILFFKKYKIFGVKSLDFYLAAKLINNKLHLTIEGLNHIKVIKSRMKKAKHNKYNLDK
jgi:hypothetical protein